MKRVVHKYTLVANTFQTVPVPKGGEFLEAREQHGEIAVWFMCNPREEIENKHIAVFGTGHPFEIEKVGRYLGQAQLENGAFIFHIFEAHNGS